MFSENGVLKIKKPFFQFKPFAAAIERAMSKSLSDFVLHFRITTSGKEDKLNTHPHRVNNKLAFVHNGVIADLSDAQSVESDTVKFKNLLSALPFGFMDNPTLKYLLEFYAVENHSKFVFMDNLGRVDIFNEKAGTWEGGLWYSNLDHRTFSKYTYTSVDNKKKTCPNCWGFSSTGGLCPDCRQYFRDYSRYKNWGIWCTTIQQYCHNPVCATADDQCPHTAIMADCEACGMYSPSINGLCPDCAAVKEFEESQEL